MSELTARYIFALFCALGMLAMGFGALLEMARFRRHARRGTAAESDESSTLVPESIISLRQYRFRLVSAVIWMIVLGALGYATAALWPERGSPQALEQARRFVTVVGAALSLLIVALVLFLWDVIVLSRERRRQTARFYQGLADMARHEAEQLKHRSTGASAPPQAADDSPPGAENRTS
jgi:hypothetical protein